MSSLTIPWCTYTSPELAHVGLQRSEGDDLHTFTQELSQVDRALLEGDSEGFVKVHLRRGSDQLVGATVVARNAGDLISEITLALTRRLGLSEIGGTIHPYPTQAESIRKLGDQYHRTRLTPLVQSALAKWFAWTR
jgi:pyruvate/2-oxoglutarate dehydrogenase complex dihydrolipoamide dehydrogenase (E3) component